MRINDQLSEAGFFNSMNKLSSCIKDGVFFIQRSPFFILHNSTISTNENLLMSSVNGTINELNQAIAIIILDLSSTKRCSR